MAAAQLEAAPLLRRLEVASEKVLSMRVVLAPRAVVASTCLGARGGFGSLPHAVALLVLPFVPADARARAALVCRAWRDTVADAGLWTVLDLSIASAVAHPVLDATLRGAAALARGGLTALCLDDCDELTQEARLEVVTANAGSLRALSCKFTIEDKQVLRPDAVRELAVAAPHLVSFKVDVQAPAAAATSLVRNEAPFGALQLHSLWIQDDDDGTERDEATVLAFLAAVSAHASLRTIEVADTLLHTPALINALSAAALACNLRYLRLNRCRLSPASVPALARLILGGLESLVIINGGVRLLDEAAAMQLADVVASSRTLTRLELNDVRLWDNEAAATAMIRALTGHPHLHEVDLSFNYAPDQLAAGTALGALVAANTPALKTLVLSSTRHGNVDLGPLFQMLPRNTHLRELDLRWEGWRPPFADHALLLSVRANTSLQKLVAGMYWQDGGLPPFPSPPEVLEAEALVAARNNGGA